MNIKVKNLDKQDLRNLKWVSENPLHFKLTLVYQMLGQQPYMQRSIYIEKLASFYLTKGMLYLIIKVEGSSYFDQQRNSNLERQSSTRSSERLQSWRQSVAHSDAVEVRTLRERKALGLLLLYHRWQIFVALVEAQFLRYYLQN